MALPANVMRADRSDGAVVVGFVAVAVYFAVLVHGMGTWPYEQWMVLVLVPLLLTAGVVGILVVTRDDSDRLTSIMIAGLVAKLGAAFVRYFVVFAVYRSGDSIAYDERGRRRSPTPSTTDAQRSAACSPPAPAPDSSTTSPV